MLYIFEIFLVTALILMSSMGQYRYPAPKKRRATAVSR